MRQDRFELIEVTRTELITNRVRMMTAPEGPDHDLHVTSADRNIKYVAHDVADAYGRRIKDVVFHEDASLPEDTIVVQHGPTKDVLYWRTNMVEAELDAYIQLRAAGASAHQAEDAARSIPAQKAQPNLITHIRNQIGALITDGQNVAAVFVSAELAPGRSIIDLGPENTEDVIFGRTDYPDEWLISCWKHNKLHRSRGYWNLDTDRPAGEIYTALRMDGLDPERARAAEDIINGTHTFGDTPTVTF